MKCEKRSSSLTKKRPISTGHSSFLIHIRNESQHECMLQILIVCQAEIKNPIGNEKKKEGKLEVMT